MLEELQQKLSLSEAVRYLLTGAVTLVAVLIAKGVGPGATIGWIEKHEWSREAAPAWLLLIAILLAGYSIWHIYRAFWYELVILRVRGLLGRLFRYPTYREYIRQEVKAITGTAISDRDAANVYAYMKATAFSQFYKDFGSPLTTGIHVLYCSASLLLVATLFRFSDLWPYSCILFFVLFPIILAVDWNFEDLELLLYSGHKAELADAIRRLDAGGAWKKRPTNAPAKEQGTG